MNDLKNLYRDTIRRHAAEPVGFRKAIAATHRFEGHNPQCGDRIEVALQVEQGRIHEAAFDGEACAICMASASLMCEQIVNKKLGQFQSMAEMLRASMKSRGEPGDIGALSPLLGVRPYPSRIQCATLPWSTATHALAQKKESR